MEQESQLISGPQESSISGSNSTPWKGRLKFSNFVNGSSQTSSRNPHVYDGFVAHHYAYMVKVI